MKRQKVVTIGAGTGMAKVLKGLRLFVPDFLELVAIVGVTDNGGHSGKIRRTMRELGLPMPQPGDGRKCLLNLARATHNFTVLPDGTNTANTYIAGLVDKYGSLSEAFSIFGAELRAAGKVIPSTDEDVEICARYANGAVIEGEWEIIKHNNSHDLEELFLNHPSKACPAAIEAIKQADQLIIGPGSLRTGIISALLPEGIAEAIQASEVPMIYVCNLMSQPGQTNDLTAADHLLEIEKYTGRLPDRLIFNIGSIPDFVLKHYANLTLDNGVETPSKPVELGNVSATVEVIEAELIPPEQAIMLAKHQRIGEHDRWTHLLTHYPDKLAKVIAKLIGLKEV